MHELPWFKFNPSLWLSGDIQYCSDASQLLFMKICCIYWKNKCQLSVKVMSKRCQMRAEKLQRCVKELQDDGMIIINNDKICIKFLDEQYSQRVHTSELNAKNGKKGGQANAKRTLSERNGIAKHIDKDKDKELKEETEQEVRCVPVDHDSNDPFQNPQPDSININPSTEWHMIKSEQWVRDIKTAGAKIGAESWENWKRIFDKHGIVKIKAACNIVDADKRWADNIEKQCSEKSQRKLGSTEGMERRADGTLII